MSTPRTSSTPTLNLPDVPSSDAMSATPAGIVLPPVTATSTGSAELDEHRPVLSPAIQEKLDDTVRQFVDAVMTLDHGSDGFKDKVKSLDVLGDAQIRAAAATQNRLMDRPMKVMKNGVFAETQNVATSLIELRKQVEDLDPSRRGDLFTVRKILGIIPFGNKLENYFDEYRSAQSHLNGIVKALLRGQDELRRDNAAIEVEKEQRWALMEELEQCLHIAQAVDARLSERLETVRASDPRKARIIEGEMLFYVRQKCIDLLTQQAVNVQGYLALDIVRRNNLELIKGVDRATTTTLSALRTAVMVCQALTSQSLVLDQITALQTTTGNLIAGMGALLNKQAVAIHQQAANSTVPIEQLKQAFQSIYSTLDAIDTFKADSLEAMKGTVTLLTSELSRAQGHLDRVRRREANDAVEQIQAPTTVNGKTVVDL